MARWYSSLLALIALVLAASATASMIAVDLGSEYLKVSLIKPGRTPIAVVTNEMSKRKTPALVSLPNGERLLGEEAFSFAVRYPDVTFSRARDMLGRTADHPVLVKLLSDLGLPFKLVNHPNRSIAAVELKGGDIYSADELVVSVRRTKQHTIVVCARSCRSCLRCSWGYTR